jgi:RNA polymerase sigma-70 factor (ECF subfamily)
MAAISEILRKARAAVLRRGAAPADADDIVQEAFARMEAYTRLHEVRSKEAFLVNAAVNIARDQARKARGAPFAPGVFDIESIADQAPSQIEALRSQEKLRRAAAGLDQLSALNRRLLLANRLDKLSYVELARREGLSVAAVEKRIARALLFLVEWMDGW